MTLETIRRAMHHLAAGVARRVPSATIRTTSTDRVHGTHDCLTFLRDLSADTLDLCVETSAADEAWIRADLVVGGTGVVIADSGPLPHRGLAESDHAVVDFVLAQEDAIVAHLEGRSLP